MFLHRGVCVIHVFMCPMSILIWDFYFRALGSLVVLSFPQPLTFPQFSPRSSLKPLADAQTGGLRSGQRP
jgi:hypothetical protein